MSTPTTEEARQAFLAHRRAHGMASAQKIIRAVIGDASLEEASEAERERIIRELGAEPGDDDGSGLTNPDGTLNTVAIFAKWNASRRAPRD